MIYNLTEVFLVDTGQVNNVKRTGFPSVLVSLKLRAKKGQKQISFPKIVITLWTLLISELFLLSFLISITLDSGFRILVSRFCVLGLPAIMHRNLEQII